MEHTELNTPTPSQGLICKGCKLQPAGHKFHKLFCVTCGNEKQVNYQRAYRGRQKILNRPVMCRDCGKEFTTGKDGRAWKCPECKLAYQREYAANRKAQMAEYSANYRARLDGEYRAYSANRRRVLMAEMTPEELAAFRQAESDKSKRLADKLKDEVFQAYGGWKCACCGETGKHYLTIDHMENNGSELRRKGVHGHSTQFYRWLKKSGFPPEFQVLCMNCNFGKRMNNGVCPHQTRCNDYP
jgi:hypothetical protein